MTKFKQFFPEILLHFCLLLPDFLQLFRFEKDVLYPTFQLGQVRPLPQTSAMVKIALLKHP